LVCLLRDPLAVVEHGQKIIDGQSPEDALRSLLALPSSGPALNIGSPDDDAADDDAAPFACPADMSTPQFDSLGLW